MREYISKKLGIDKSLYNRVKTLIADYDRMRKERLNVLYGGGKSLTGMPKGNSISDPTANKGVRLARLDEDIAVIDSACVEMRGIFSDRVHETFDPIKAYWSYNYFNYIYLRTDNNVNGPSKSTWVRYKYILTKLIANKANYI